MPHDTPLQPDLRSGREDMHIGEGAEMTFRKPAGPTDRGQRANALWTADSGRAIVKTRLRGLWYVLGRRS